MNRAGNVALAVGLGYALGRRHKLSLAMALAAAAATGQLGKGPLGRMLAGTGGGSEESGAQASGDGGGAVSSVARSALSKPWEVLADRLNERAEALRQDGQSGAEGGQS